jgi:hypothetical protein
VVADAISITPLLTHASLMRFFFHCGRCDTLVGELIAALMTTALPGTKVNAAVCPLLVKADV